MSTVKIHSIARAVAYPDSEASLIGLIEELGKSDIPFFVVGRMSNVLAKSKIYNGVLIKTTKIKNKTKAETHIKLSCGCSLAPFVREMADFDLGGFEGLLGIPGTVGGMVRQNAGAYGYEISDRFVSAECYVKSTRSIVQMSKKDMHFTYRDSALTNKDLVLLNATFSFLPKAREDIFSEISEYARKRKSSQPIEFPSLGCTFKRCSGIGAGYYIDRAGLKGYSVGGARFSEKHAGFIINTGDATADEYLQLLEYAKEKVYSTFGINLEEEIEIID